MIKNECGHAYKLLDHAECLWCENCVEELVERLSKKPEVTKEFVEKWYQKSLFIPFDKSKQTLIEMLKEAGVEVVK